MISLVDKNPIRKAFSNAAVQYDLLTSLHKEIGRDLIKKIRDIESCSSILDVGMGTGWLTNKLAFYFPEAKVSGIDFSEGMIDEARKKNREGTRIVQADAYALPFQNKSFDIIASNLSFQWVDDLPQAFKDCHRCLKDKGTFAFTMFGRQTFQELFVSLEHAADGKSRGAIQRLAGLPDVVRAMEHSGFRGVKADYERIITHFSDMFALTRWVKDIGANAIKKDIYIGKELLLKANEYYNENFKDKFGVSSTFEVLWITAKK